jgi:hypothetical protein
MTTTNAKLILASKNAHTGDILYTWVLTFPRVILPEVNTHRVFSRNTASSRAIPARKQRQRVWEDPFVPEYIGANRKGMQAGVELVGWRRTAAEALWRYGRLPALAAHWGLEKLGVHKQIVNRMIEPWTWTQQIVSMTDLKNFFAQRNHKDAEPHFHKLAEEMQEAVSETQRIFKDMRQFGDLQYEMCGVRYQILRYGEWHLPFMLWREGSELPLELQKKISAARCARVSYRIPDTGAISTPPEDLELYERLAGSNPKHLTPLEHQATPLREPRRVGNLRGWRQFRKEIAGENPDDLELAA